MCSSMIKGFIVSLAIQETSYLSRIVLIIVDHLVHQILTMFAIGASPDEITTAYNKNKSYQRPALPSDEAVVQSLYDKSRFKDLTGNGQNYPHFLAFFQQEIDKKGVAYVLNEYVFKGDDTAESMMSRLFGGMSL